MSTRKSSGARLLFVCAALAFGTACGNSNKSPEQSVAEAGAAGTLASAAGRGGSSSGGAANGGASSAGAVNGGASSGAAGLGGTSSNGGDGGASSAGTGASAGQAAAGGASDYDALVLADSPVAFWDINQAPRSEPDLSGNGHDGSYRGSGSPTSAQLPNGDSVAVFDGATQYLTVPSSAAFSIPTTGNLTWEGWIRPDMLQFPHDGDSSGYVDWLGKCESYAPTCEWEGRMYDTQTKESPNRPNRLSAYVFNPGANLGSAADWQPGAGVIVAGAWYHVVGEYTTLTQPADCANTNTAPGSIDIWVNGVKWNHASHGQTGCMSQYSVVPKANDSAVNIGTMALDTFFLGAIGKVAIYAHLLSQAQIASHYTKMTGKTPSGSCADTCSF